MKTINNIDNQLTLSLDQSKQILKFLISKIGNYHKILEDNLLSNKSRCIILEEYKRMDLVICSIYDKEISGYTISKDIIHNYLHNFFNYFDKNDILSDTVKESHNILIDVIKHHVKQSKEYSYSLFVDLMINIINELILELLEIESLLYDQKGKLFISNFCISIYKTLNKSVAYNRLRFYINKFDVTDYDIIFVTDDIKIAERCYFKFINDFKNINFNFQIDNQKKLS